MRWVRIAIAGAVVASLVTTAVVGGAVRAHTRALRPAVVVRHDVHRDVSPPLRAIRPTPPTRRNGRAPRELDLPRVGSTGLRDPVVQRQASAAVAAPTAGAGFEGLGRGIAGSVVNSAPPDTNGDIGPTSYVEVVNAQFAVFSRTGSLLYGPVNTNTLWRGFGGACETTNDGDATVKYDRLANRWVISQFSVATRPYQQCVAVSTTANPAGSYYRYAFSYGNTDFPDYPKLGVWPDAYYTTYNIFSANQFTGGKVCAFDRSRMLAGLGTTQQCFNTSAFFGGLLPSDLDGSTPPPAGSPNYVVDVGTTSLNLWKFHVDWARPASSTLTGPTAIPVAAFSAACGTGSCVPQAGTPNRLDSLGDRLMYRLAYRNLGDHESLVLNHSVVAGSSVGIRWYELRDPGGTPAIYQQSTYAPDGLFRWMGSIAMDRAGDIGLGYSVSSAATKPAIRYTGRLAGDPPSTLGTEATLVQGNGSQTGTLHRWGDYASMSVDPVDDCTFWFASEYLAADGAYNWRTRIGSFRFPSCGAPQAANDFSLAASPGALTVQQGQSGSVAVATQVTAGAAETVALSATGLPAGATVGFSPASVGAGGSSTMTVETGTAAAGTYTITVTGTSPSATHTTTVTLTVRGNDFSIGASPAAVTAGAGQAATSTIATSVSVGSAEAIVLSAAGAPAGASVTFAPASVNAGDSSTMTVTNTSAPAGTYTVTVTGTSASATHATTVTLTVPGGPNPVANGGFETGVFAPWTPAGTVAPVVVGSGQHAGGFAARPGAPTAYRGDSTFSQTITVPAGGATLTYWYSPHCPDSLTYDQLQAQIRSTAGAVRATVMNVCSNTGVWTQKTFSLAAFAGQTVVLWFNVHDDGYPTDPSYMLVDDVSIQ
jgi:hypothetical protein